MTICRFCPIMAIVLKTSDISLFTAGAGGALEEVEGRDILYQWSKPSNICLAPSLTYSTAKASPLMQGVFSSER